jgi:hypothetical protein
MKHLKSTDHYMITIGKCQKVYPLLLVERSDQWQSQTTVRAT